MAKGKKSSALEVATNEATSKGVTPFELAALKSTDTSVKQMATERLKALGVSTASILALGGSSEPAKQERPIEADFWTGAKNAKMVTIGYVGHWPDGRKHVRGWSWRVADLNATEIDRVIAAMESYKATLTAKATA